MANITAALVKELRQRTGSGIIECKKALIQSEGNISLAIDYMRQSGQAKAVKKSVRLATEGMIITKMSQDGKYGVIMEFNCETDFVVKNSSFNAFSQQVITTALNERITDIKELKKTFEDQRIALVDKMSENINIRRLGILKGERLGCYLHGKRIGVIVSTTDLDEKLIKHIAMHIAASKPEYIDSNSIPIEMMDHEHQIQLDMAIRSGKSYDIAKKIVLGRMRKLMNEITLMGQQFVIDPSKTVGQILDENGGKINHFIRFELGEGIEKTEINFSDEVNKINQKF